MARKVVQDQNMTEESNRKRTAHKKSRRGCGNCKIRRVKCDETKPKCNKCTSYGVSCNYDGKATELQMAFDGVATIKPPETPPVSTNQIVFYQPGPAVCLYPPVISIDRDSVFPLDSHCLDLLARFQERTVVSIGSPAAGKLFQSESVSMALSHPFLMHIIMTVTSIHDRYLLTGLRSRQTISEIYHLSQAAALFNKKLNKPIELKDCDALWTAAALMGFIAMCWNDALSPEEAWPLTKSSPSDLEWIRMSESKSVIWKLTNPLRPGSMFSAMADEYQRLSSVSPPKGIEGLRPEFVKLYELDESSNADSNPYFGSVHALAPLLTLEANRFTIGKFFSFLTHMGPKYKSRLHQKDPRALLLMAYWYSRTIRSVWWLEERALIECQAICLYLERYHPDETEVHDMLEYPKISCGLK